MADRYWVNGTGSWSNIANWSTTSGGTAGASVPTSADNAIFNTSSSVTAYVVTVTDNATCANLTVTPTATTTSSLNPVFNVNLNFVIAGTFSTSGTLGNRRVTFRSSTYGLTRDMQIAAIGSVTDVDFRDIRVTGAGGTLTGTRIGNLGGNSGITFSAPKTVYWVTAAGGNWSSNNWAASSGGAASTDNFPLAQDTAVIENTGLNTSATVTLDSGYTYFGSINMSTRTNAMTFTPSNAYTAYGNFTLSSAVTVGSGTTITFSGRNTQVITSAGKSLSGITIDSYGGTVELADALSATATTITVTNGTFDTKGYSVTAATLSSTAGGVRRINLGASTVTLSANFLCSLSSGLTMDAGTSSIVMSGSSPTFDGGGLTFYGVSFTSTVATAGAMSGSNTFNNLSFSGPASAGVRQLSIGNDIIITGAMTSAGASAVRRVVLLSSGLGTTKTITAGSLSADDCDFRDITIAGAAAGSSPTRAGDCGGNSGVTFPAAKTVYWNLAGTQNWTATAWATGSGGTPALNNFPLAQDTAVFDNTGAAGTVTVQTLNIGTVNMSARTSAMTLTTSTNTPTVHGNWLFGTGVTSTSTTGTITFAGRGTSTITSNGVSFGCPVTINCAAGTVQLADALVLGATQTLILTSGTFDAVTYNVTAGLFTIPTTSTKTLNMGSGTWTLSGVGFVWDMSGINGLTFYKGSANIVLSDTSTTTRTFVGSGLSYNKLTIGGATGTSTFTITGNNQFSELASTKTVAHTIAFGTAVQTFGKWSVTGTVGNVVTLTGTSTTNLLVGACTNSIDYLAMGSIGFATTSPGEFYAGANSTGTAAAPVYFTAKPADSTRYWVGGTGNWSDTARWSTSSGGSGGASLPRSHDNVVFDSLSNATAYTATVDAITGGNRCKALTIAGPLVGNVTLAGSIALYIHDNLTFPATGMTRTYTGNITFSGSATGKTITTNGVTFGSSATINGVGCGWSLGSAWSDGGAGATLTLTNGSFDTANYAFTFGTISSSNSNTRSLSLGSSTLAVTGFSTGFTNSTNLTFNAGTSQINCSNVVIFNGGGLTFYNVSLTSTAIVASDFRGTNTFNNLSITGRSFLGISSIIMSNNQTINGTLTLSAGANATARTFVRSDAIGTTRTITCAAFSGTDIDFRDITIAGAAAPASGTRLGDCKGNTGITFASGVNKYWNLAGGGNWSTAAWATSSGGSPAVSNFPLAQDTCVFEATGLNSGASVVINAPFNIGTVDMSARTTNTMTLTCGDVPFFYGSWINGTGTTLSSSGTFTFAGRGSHTITSAGRTFTQSFSFDNPGGSVTLQDAFQTNASATFFMTKGTFDANGYNVTLSGTLAAVSSANSNTRTIAIGSGTWTIAGSSISWNTGTIVNLTVTGTGTISQTSSTTKTFAGGGYSYSGITLNQGGAGALTVSGDNTFANITNTYSATGATNLNFGASTQRVNNFTAKGEAGRVLTIQGTSATTPCTLIHIGTGDINLDYLTITGVRAYPL